MKITFVGSESSTSWAVSYCSKFNRSSSLDLISVDAIPSVIEELASSPSSSDMSMAKENKLSGESCSWKKKKISYPKLSFDNAKSDRSDDLLVSRQFLVSGVGMQRAL